MSPRDPRAIEDPDDLLRPALGPDHEPTSFDRPLPPWNMVFVAFLAGPLLGGVVMAWNFARLGMRAQRGRWLLGFVLIWLAGNAVVLSVDRSGAIAGQRPEDRPPAFAAPAQWTTDPGIATPSMPMQRSLFDEARSASYRLTAFRRRFFDDPIRLLPRVLGVLLAAWAAYRQSKRFELFERSPDYTPTHYPAWQAIAFAVVLLVIDLAASFVYAVSWAGIARLLCG